MITILLLCYNTVTKAASRRVYLAYSSRGVIVHDNRAEMVRQAAGAALESPHQEQQTGSGENKLGMGCGF